MNAVISVIAKLLMCWILSCKKCNSPVRKRTRHPQRARSTPKYSSHVWCLYLPPTLVLHPETTSINFLQLQVKDDSSFLQIGGAKICRTMQDLNEQSNSAEISKIAQHLQLQRCGCQMLSLCHDCCVASAGQWPHHCHEATSKGLTLRRVVGLQAGWVTVGCAQNHRTCNGSRTSR